MAIAAGLKADDEVIVPNYTMIATPNSIKLFGGIPVFVDVEKDTLCMDLNSVKKAITPKTKAILFMNANGRYPNSGIDTFIELCKKHNLILLEDSAQALGSWYPDGKHQGTHGLAGSFSFSAPKVISTGQGGAIITNDDEMAFRLRRLKDFGRSGGGNDLHDSIGYNFKFTDIQAVIGIEQMKKLDFRLDRKKEIYKLYKKELENINQIKFFNQDLTFTSPWFIDVIVEKREGLINYLKVNGIGTRVMYPPINKQKAYRQLGDYPISDYVGQNGLWLPSASQLTDFEIKEICTKIREFYKN
jgi:perosamine synthetase